MSEFHSLMLFGNALIDTYHSRCNLVRHFKSPMLWGSTFKDLHPQRSITMRVYSVMGFRSSVKDLHSCIIYFIRYFKPPMLWESAFKNLHFQRSNSMKEFILLIMLSRSSLKYPHHFGFKTKSNPNPHISKSFSSKWLNDKSRYCRSTTRNLVFLLLIWLRWFGSLFLFIFVQINRKMNQINATH